jgi:hypothetical protein
VRIEGTYRPDDGAGTEAGVGLALEQLGLPPTAARLWLASAAGRLGTPARWVLDYDPDLELATFEVHVDGHMVFGLDDWLPQTAAGEKVE